MAVSLQRWALGVTLGVLIIMLELESTRGASVHTRTMPAITRSRYTAAVYEHSPIEPEDSKIQVVTREAALELMQRNLDIYSVQTQEARKQGAEILVFPEDGLYGYQFTRETIKPYLEFIPDPDVITWSPCDDPKRFPNTEVQHHLSCLAKNHAIYIVADMGDIQVCNAAKQPNQKCPSDGVLQYNTAVAYDLTGTLVAKYHKRHLFFEVQFDRPEAQVKYFDTPFGRFGLFICFDILFQSPALDMVTEHGINNVIFPTAWMDALPLLPAIGWHSSFAMANRVNLLAANLHKPSEKFQGSGIYTPYGKAEYYYDNRLDSNSSLIVGQLDVIPNRQPSWPKLRPEVFDDWNLNTTTPVAGRTSGESFENKGYNFVALTDKTASTSVCKKEVCCSLDYVSLDNPASELIVLGAFDDLLLKKYYSRVCAVYKCPKDDKTKCGSYTFNSTSTFSRAELRMWNISSQGISRPADILFPEVIVTNPDGQLGLAEAENMVMSRSRASLLWYGSKSPLIAMALVGRDFDKDHSPGTHSPDPSPDKGSNTTPSHALLFVAVFQTVVFLLKVN